MQAVPVTFTVEELWMLQELVEHQPYAFPKEKYPSVDTELGDELARAITACEKRKLQEYTLFLNRAQLLLLSSEVKPASKTAEGAMGKEILKKVLKARVEMLEED